MAEVRLDTQTQLAQFFTCSLETVSCYFITGCNVNPFAFGLLVKLDWVRWQFFVVICCCPQSWKGTDFKSQGIIALLPVRKTNNWHNFVGCDKNGDCAAQLSLFWDRWKFLRPNHQIFQCRDVASLQRTLPLLLHGDEGRGAKRQGLMCLSVAPILGRGVATRSKKGTPNRSDRQLMNYVGRSFATRFLLGVLPKKAYENNPDVFQTLVSILASDFQKLAKDGVTSPISGEKYFVGVLHTANTKGMPRKVRCGF